MVKTGKTVIDKGTIKMNELLFVIHTIRLHPRYLQSDFCRYNAFAVAEAASRGYISSVCHGEAYNRWFVTKKGLELLQEEGYDY